MKNDEVCGICSTHGTSKHVDTILVGILMGKRPERSWKDNITFYLREIKNYTENRISYFTILSSDRPVCAVENLWSP
jgi:hypothetical protein